MLAHVAALIGLAIAAPPEHAERRIAIPSGWTASMYDASAGVVAAVLHPVGELAPTQVVQVRGQQSTLTPIPGKAFGVAVSPAGTHVLIAYVEEIESEISTCGGPPSFCLLDADGDVLWTKAPSPWLSFSTTGQVLFTPISPISPMGGRATRVEVLALDGSQLRTFDAPQPPWAAVVFGEGRRVVLGLGPRLVAIEAGDPAPPWTLPLAGDETMPLLHDFSARLMLLERGFGWFRLVGDDGTVRFSFDQEWVDRADPGGTWPRPQSFTPHPTGDPDRILLWDRSPEAVVVHLPTGAATRVTLPMTPPPGMEHVGPPRDGLLLFSGDGEIILRTLPPMP